MGKLMVVPTEIGVPLAYCRDFLGVPAALDALRALIVERHARFNDTLYQLEPDVKEAPGANGVFNVSAADHNGFDNRARYGIARNHHAGAVGIAALRHSRRV